MGEWGHDEEVASSKKNRIEDWSAKSDTLFMTKMAKIDTLFMTKTPEKPYPLGPHIVPFFFLCVFMDRDGVEGNKHTKMDGPISVILTEQAGFIKDLL